MNERQIIRGDIYCTVLPHGTGSEQHGLRPMLVLQNNLGNKYSRTVIAAAITGQVEKAKLPTHCLIKAQQGLGRDSLVLLEQLHTIDKTRLHEYIGTLNDEDMYKVEKALAVSLGLEKRRLDMFELTLCPRCESYFRHNGYLLVKKGWQEFKTTCDICNDNQGWIFSILS